MVELWGLLWVVLAAGVSFLCATAVARHRLGRIEKDHAEFVQEAKENEVREQKLRHDVRDQLGARIGGLENRQHELELRLATQYHNKEDMRTLLGEMLQPIRDAQNQQNAKLERLLERTRVGA